MDYADKTGRLGQEVPAGYQAYLYAEMAQNAQGFADTRYDPPVEQNLRERMAEANKCAEDTANTLSFLLDAIRPRSILNDAKETALDRVSPTLTHSMGDLICTLSRIQRQVSELSSHLIG